MGCGISTLEAEDSKLNPRSNRAHRHRMVPPIVIDKKKDFENGDEGHFGMLYGNNNNKDFVMEMKPLGNEEARDINERSIGKRLQEKSGGDDKHCAKNVEEEHEDRDYIYNGPGSPSFREYCNDYDCGDRSSIEDSNDCDSMDHSIKNGSNDDFSNKNNKTKNGGIVNSKQQEYEKKEKRGRGFRNVINRGKGRGRKNLLNFGCYNASNESYDVGSSFNKVAAKTA